MTGEFRFHFHRKGYTITKSLAPPSVCNLPNVAFCLLGHFVLKSMTVWWTGVSWVLSPALVLHNFAHVLSMPALLRGITQGVRNQ